MQINTITCHNVYNYGATLQAYALQTELESKGHQVEIIDFQPYFHRNRYNLLYVPQESKCYSISQRFPFVRIVYGLFRNRKIYRTYGRKSKFDKFTKNFLHLTARQYTTYDQLAAMPPKADLYIAGSDQIWNTESSNGKEAAYYLDFGSKNIKRASYAASFGVEKTNDSYSEFIKQHVSLLDYITVREETGANILFNLGIDEVKVVVDPVFLISKDKWKELSNKASITLPTNDYLLVYDFIGDERIEQFALKVSKIMNCRIVSINDFSERFYADYNINDAGPIEFLHLIANTKLVISNSFHATAFSILFEKEFYTFSLITQHNSTRMTSVLKELQIKNRFNPVDLALNAIAYPKVYEILKEKIKYSKQELNNILQLVEQ